jgi:hypothetical protein
MSNSTFPKFLWIIILQKLSTDLKKLPAHQHQEYGQERILHPSPHVLAAPQQPRSKVAPLPSNNVSNSNQHCGPTPPPTRVTSPEPNQNVFINPRGGLSAKPHREVKPRNPSPTGPASRNEVRYFFMLKHQLVAQHLRNMMFPMFLFRWIGEPPHGVDGPYLFVTHVSLPFMACNWIRILILCYIYERMTCCFCNHMHCRGGQYFVLIVQVVHAAFWSTKKNRV